MNNKRVGFEARNALIGLVLSEKQACLLTKPYTY